MQVTATAGVNIAVIKYWGKRDEALVLPVNSSLSVTLSQDCMKTTTTISAQGEGCPDEFWLNGKMLKIENHPRISKVIDMIRCRAPERLCQTNIRVKSYNDFPTAAGLASSASGLACLSK